VNQYSWAYVHGFWFMALFLAEVYKNFSKSGFIGALRLDI
jgi:hypothetical protein